MKFSTAAASVILFSPATVLAAASKSKAGKRSSSVTTTTSKAGKAAKTLAYSYSNSMSVDTNMPTVAPTVTFEPTATPSYPPTFHPTTSPSTKPSFSPSISLEPTVTEPPSDSPSQSQTPTISAAPSPDPMMCGRSYSGDDVVVRLNRNLECRQDNTIPGPDAAFTLSNGATLDCGGYELSMGNDVNIDFGIKLFDTASVRNCGVSKFVMSNARIEAQSGTTTIVNSTFSSSSDGYGVFLKHLGFDDSGFSNVLVLKDVTANNNFYDGFLFGSQTQFLLLTQHKIKLEGEIRAYDNGQNGIGVHAGHVIQVFGQVEVKNNPWGFYLMYPGEVNMTLIDDATFTSCNNTVYDMSNMNLGEEKHGKDNLVEHTEFNPKDGAYFCDTQDRPELARLPNCRPCNSSPELI